MKKIIFSLFLLILSPATVLAWDDCSYGEVDCLYPGDCSRYIDTDNDGICDHSQPAPEDRNTEIEIINTQIAEGKSLITNNERSKAVYHLVPISLFLFFLYFITYILSKKKIISVVGHRKLWNFLLITTFLISGLLGILLVIKINFGITVSLPFNTLFWHVEAGIAMFIISIFHTLWHWTYFKNMFKIKK